MVNTCLNVTWILHLEIKVMQVYLVLFVSHPCQASVSTLKVDNTGDISKLRADIEAARKVLGMNDESLETLTEESVASYAKDLQTVHSSPFKRPFLVQLMGARLSERLSEFTTFIRTKRAVLNELSHLILG